MNLCPLVLVLGSLLAGEAKQIPVGPGVTLEMNGDMRRVIVQSRVVLRKGPLEGLLTREKKKEHEYILAADVDARHIHTALELARARAGKPVTFSPKFQPAEGSAVKILLRFEQGGKKMAIPAGDWIREDRTNKALPSTWVFAGSRFGPNPDGPNKPPFYLANHGDLICVVNMESALLDLPHRSPKAFNDRIYRADTDSIPEVGTRVEVILEPQTMKPR
ncbi:MAG: YdjY domain-containing protein [Gemmataceae bacterium]